MLGERTTDTDGRMALALSAAELTSPGEYGVYFRRFLASDSAVFYAAYGNATSDIHGYEVAGIPKERTYILGTNGGASGTVALGQGYTEHIEAVRDEPAADQPFRR